MPRPGWASTAELKWLEERIPRFRVAQSQAKIPSFKKVVWQEYFDQFYPDVTSSGAGSGDTTVIAPLDPSKASEEGKPLTISKRQGVSIRGFMNTLRL